MLKAPMVSTPVRVRGKKRNLSLVKSAIAKQFASAKRQRLDVQTAKRRPAEISSAMPTLQGLPQELLEMIFLYSMNISLPRASPELGRKLSSQAICMEMCLRNFFWTVDHKSPIRSRSVTSNPIVQSQLLACKFFDWNFFLAYVERAHEAFKKLRGKAWAKTGVTVPDASWFEGLWPFRYTKITYLSLAEGFRIPEKLLHGPWTEGRTNLLYTLVSLNGEIDWKGSMEGETAKLGIREAIDEKNERAVAALAVLLGIAKAITTDTLRHAVIQAGCDMNIMRHILFNAQILYAETSRDVLDLHDPIVWRWADEEGQEDGRGEDLKSMLKKAETFDLQFYRDADEERDWRSIIPFPYTGDKFDARANLDNVVAELLTMLYRNYGRRITRRRTIQSAEHPDVAADQADDGT